MDPQNISLDPLKGRTVAVLGYGNQGRAHALNLRDSGVNVLVGSRRGASWEGALRDGFAPKEIADAASSSDVVIFLFPDQVIPTVFREIQLILEKGSQLMAFAHGFAFHYGLVPKLPGRGYFLAAPKGAGAVLRARFEQGGGLPGVFAVAEGSPAGTREVCLAYAKAIGITRQTLIETSFREETECDLFGEQAVLCGGLMRLMEMAFDTLVKHGHSREMAFIECAYEAKLIMELWLKFGPRGMTDRISPTAFYGGLTRGKRLVDDRAKAEMEKMFEEIRSGDFAREWLEEVAAGMPRLASERDRLSQSGIEEAFQNLRDRLNP